MHPYTHSLAALALLLSAARAQEPARLGRIGEPNTLSRDLHGQSIAFSDDGKTLAWIHGRGMRDRFTGSLRLHWWDVEKQEELKTIIPEEDGYWASGPIRFVPGGRMCLVGAYQLAKREVPGRVTYITSQPKAFFLEKGIEIFRFDKRMGDLSEAVHDMAVSKDGKQVTVLTNVGGWVMRVTPPGVAFEVNQEILHRFKLRLFRDSVLGRHGEVVAGITMEDGNVRIWSLPEAKETRKLAARGLTLAFSADAKLLATYEDGNVLLWDVETGMKTWGDAAKLSTHKGTPGVAFSADARLFAFNDDGVIRIVDTLRGRSVRQFKGQPGPVAFAPDGRRLAQVCPDGSVLMWEVK